MGCVISAIVDRPEHRGRSVRAENKQVAEKKQTAENKQAAEKKQAAIHGAREPLSLHIQLQPGEQLLKFEIHFNEQVSCCLRLMNSTDSNIAFKLQSNSPETCRVMPCTGLVLPRSCSNVTVTTEAEATPDMQSKDRFLVHSVIVPFGSTLKDITPQLFDKNRAIDKILENMNETRPKLEPAFVIPQSGDLKFPFVLKKQISCSLRLVNTTDEYIAFKVQTNSPKKYCVRPNGGLALPQSCTDVTLTMQAQQERPSVMQCHDKFLVKSVIIPFGSTIEDVTSKLLNKEAGKKIHQTKLRVSYVAPSFSFETVQETRSPVHVLLCA